MNRRGSLSHPHHPRITLHSSTPPAKSSSGGMLPLWMSRGRPVSIPITRNHTLNIPLLPTLLLLSALYGLSFLLRHPHPSLNDYPSSPFRVPQSRFLAPPTEPIIAKPAYLPDPLPPKQAGMVVPNSVHYVYGLKPLGDGETAPELPYYAYLAVRSAIVNIRPAKIYFHYTHLPTGPWMELLLPYLTLIETQAPDSIYGKSISHFAHKADVLRLLALKHSGGIYLDIDVYVVKPFDDLLYAPTTLGMESATDSRRSALDPEGLCNAVIVSAPGARFIDRWLESYQTFDEGVWARHSVQVPWELARSYPDEIQVLNKTAFFWPMWFGEEIQYTHERDDYDFKATGQYAYHAWESLAMKYLGNLSPKRIKEENNSFNRLVREFIGPEDEDTYRRWKGDG